MHRFSLSLQHLGKIRSLKSAISITVTRFQIPRRQVYSKAKEMALYDPIQPYKTEFFKVSPIHTLYVEQSGNPEGKPALFVHGGPGGGVDDKDRQRFDPKTYRIVLFDQRGAGRSTPPACLEENTTWDLVSDIEKIREHLGIEKWLVFGGSWGSTLSLAYAQTHPDRVTSLVLRGIFTLRRSELEYFYQGPGSNWLFPDYWEKYLELIPEEERSDMIAAYYKRLISEDPEVRSKAAQAWSTWECATSRLHVDPKYIAKVDVPGFADAFARIEAHYFFHGGFFQEDGFLLLPSQIDKIRHIPTTIVQGRYDVVCPIKSAWDLHKVWPEAQFIVIPDAGHSAIEEGTQRELVKATDEYRSVQ